MRILLVFIVAISVLFIPVQDAEAGSVSSCDVYVANPYYSSANVEGSYQSIWGPVSFSCPYTSQFTLSIEMREDVPLYTDRSLGTQTYYNIFNTVYGTITRYGSDGCTTGYGKYFTKAKLTDMVTGYTKTVSGYHIGVAARC